MFEYIKEFLKINDVKFLEDVSLRSFSSVKIGGKASILAYPEDEAAFSSLVSFLKGTGVKFIVLGRMSNVLARDDGYNGVIIKTDKMSKLSVSDSVITASAGVSLPLLVHRAVSLGISGFEELSGIPGSVGGGVAGNAGAFGREFSDIITEVFVCDLDCGDCYSLKPSEINFGYRTSLFKNTICLVLSAKFKGFCSDRILVKLRENDFLKKRKETQPQGQPSLGSVFKRTEDGISAGYLIDRCGLKGYRVGDAQISTVHAGFIVNLGEATASDYLKCAGDAAKCVKTRFGINLNKEIVLL